MKRLIASVTVCAALALASQAAAEDMITHSASVSVAGVDFSDSAQVDGLYGKLKTSARKMCRGDIRSLAARADEGACRKAAMDAAVKAASQQALAQRHITLASR